MKLENKKKVLPKKLNSQEEKQRTELGNIVREITRLFINVDYNIEYELQGDILFAIIFLAPPLSITDIENLENLTTRYNFSYSVISDREKINRKNRNSKIEIYLNREVKDE